MSASRLLLLKRGTNLKLDYRRLALTALGAFLLPIASSLQSGSTWHGIERAAGVGAGMAIAAAVGFVQTPQKETSDVTG